MQQPIKLPLISICIPTYNGAKFLSECLNSILAQQFNDMEVVISDDNSSDNTLEICSDFKNKASFPVHIYSHQPSGLADNWNFCVQHATGKYIKFLFQDDLLIPECLSVFTSAIHQNYASQFIFCNRDFIIDKELQNDETTIKWIERYHNLGYHWKFDLTKGMDGKKLLSKSSNLFSYPLNKIGEPSTTLISRDLFNENRFDPQFHQMTDIEFYYRILPISTITFIDEKLVKIRLHNNQATAKNLAEDKADEDLLLYEVLKNKIGKHLHRSTRLFPLKYKAKKRIKKLLGK